MDECSECLVEWPSDWPPDWPPEWLLECFGLFIVCSPLQVSQGKLHYSDAMAIASLGSSLMLHQSTSDVLSPRELRRQLVRYFLYSMLFWVILSICGALFFLNLEVVPGKELALWTSPLLIASFLWRLFVFALISAAWGALLALPSVALVWMANSGSAFASRPEGAVTRLRRGIAQAIPPLLCFVFHAFFLIVSLTSSPIFISRLDAGDGAFWTPANILYELFYVEPASEIAKGWRKAFSETESALLVVALPSQILQNPANFPLLEKELGAPVPFFLGSPTFELQLENILHSEHSLDAVHPVLRSFAGERQLPLNEKFVVSIAPEYASILEGKQGEVSAFQFLSQRFALTQPQLGFLGRAGLLGHLFAGMEWHSVDADDSFALSCFLDQINAHPEAQVRVLQLTALGMPEPLGGIHPRRYPTGASKEISRDVLKSLDLQLGRALGALRQNRKLSIVVLPYAERFNSHEFSNAFVRVASAGRDPFSAKVRSRKSFGTLSDVSQLRPGSSPEKVFGLSGSGVVCEPVRVAPELFLSGANEVRQDLLRSSFGLVQPSLSHVLYLPPEALVLGADLYRLAAICRDPSNVMQDDRLVVWMGEGGVDISEKKWPVLRDDIVSVSQPQLSRSGPTAQRGGSGARKIAFAERAFERLPVLAVDERLLVYRLPVGSPPVLDEAGARFVEVHAEMLRSVFSTVVMRYGMK